MMDIKIFTNGGEQAEGREHEGTGGGGGSGVGIYIFFDILLYYFINVMLKTLYISSFIVVYLIYFTHIVYIVVFLCVFPFS